jgi:hypothetical protein
VNSSASSLVLAVAAGGALALAGYAVGRRAGAQAPLRAAVPAPAAWTAVRPVPSAPDDSAGRWARLAAAPRSPAAAAEAGAALEDLARQDPARAMALSLQQHNRLRRTDWLHAALRGWAAVDPGAAAAAVARLPAAEQEEAEAAVMTGAVRDPAAAVALTRALMEGDPLGRRSDANHLLSALNQAGDYAQAVDFAASLPPEVRTEMLGTAYQSWAQAEPEDALAAAARQPEGEARATAVDAALSGWSQVDPAGLARHALDLPPGPDRSQALQLALGEWVQDDPAAATAWLNAAAARPELDPGIAAVAAQPQVIARQPEVAANWAEAITDPALRSRTLASVLQDWASSNPEAARRYALNSGGLQADDRTALLAAIDGGNAPP